MDLIYKCLKKLLCNLKNSKPTTNQLSTGLHFPYYNLFTESRKFYDDFNTQIFAFL